MVKVNRFISPAFDSNTYLLELINGQVIIIDPGNPDVSPLTSWLTENKKELAAVMLTHEHFDHCAGVNPLFQWSPFELICSKSAAKNIGNNRQNFSFYIDKSTAFEIDHPVRVVSNREVIIIGTAEFLFIETPGHSPGGNCIRAGTAIFTGDTLLNNSKTPLTFPHSSKKDYQASIEKLKALIEPGMTIYPGHGQPFVFNGVWS